MNAMQRRGTLGQRLVTGRIPGDVYGVTLVVLTLVTTIEVSARSAEEALANPVDAGVVVELAVWGSAGGWAGLRLLRRPGFISDFPRGIGPALSWLLVIGTVALLSALSLGSAFAAVKAVQLWVLLVLAILVQHDVRERRISLDQVWRGVTRTLVPTLVALIGVSAALPGRFVAPDRIDRFGLLDTHPIGTGQLLGLAVLLCAASMLTGRPKFSRPERVLLPVFALVMTGALWATAARGALAATAAALLALLFLAPASRTRAAGMLAGLGVTALLVGGIADQALRRNLVRGQSADALAGLSGRDELFRYAATLFEQRPILGHGYQSGRYIYLREFPWAGESHNALVEIAVSLGMVGLIAYGTLFVAIAIAVLPRLGAATDRPRVAWIVALSASLVLNGVVADSFAGPVGTGTLVLTLLVLEADELHATSRRSFREARSRAAMA